MMIDVLIKDLHGDRFYLWCGLRRADDGDLFWCPMSYIARIEEGLALKCGTDNFTTENDAIRRLGKRLPIVYDEIRFCSKVKTLNRQPVHTYCIFNQLKWENALEDSDVSQNS